MLAWVHAKLLQSCPTLCNPMGYSPPGSSLHGIPQARILERVAMPPPGDLPNPGMKPMSLKSPALAGGFITTSVTLEAPSAQVIAGSKTPQLLGSLHSSGRK